MSTRCKEAYIPGKYLGALLTSAYKGKWHSPTLWKHSGNNIGTGAEHAEEGAKDAQTAGKWAEDKCASSKEWRETG